MNVSFSFPVLNKPCSQKLNELFHDGSPYHIETSLLICWFLYVRDFRHEKFNLPKWNMKFLWVVNKNEIQPWSAMWQQVISDVYWKKSDISYEIR